MSAEATIYSLNQQPNLSSERFNSLALESAIERFEAAAKRRLLDPKLDSSVEVNRDSSQALQYNGQFDVSHYLDVFRIDDSQKRAEQLRELDGFVRRQLETHLKEVCTVELSSFSNYVGVRNGKRQLLNSKGYDAKPVLEMVGKGRDQWNKVGKTVDVPRQNAEYKLAEELEELFTNPNTPIGTMRLVFSPPGDEGTNYLHNFYDVYELVENENKEREVKIIRYTSALSFREIYDAITDPEFSPNAFKNFKESGLPLDAFIKEIAIPIDKNRFKSSYDLHAYLHRDHPFLTVDEFDDGVLKACESLITQYIQAMHNLESNPRDDYYTYVFNTLLITALEMRDHILESKVKAVNSARREVHEFNNYKTYAYEINQRAAQLDPKAMRRVGQFNNVQQGGGACPGERGMRNKNNPFGSDALGMNSSPLDVLSDANIFTQSSGEAHGFECPSCGGWIPWGSGDSCPHCSMTKQKWADKGNEVC